LGTIGHRQSPIAIANRKFLPLLLLYWAAALGVLGAEPTGRILTLPATGKTGFTHLESQGTGIHFTNYLSDERSITNRNLLSGAGVAAGDVDGDGWCDLFFCRLGAPSTLYRNLGNWTFKDVTEQAGVSCGNQDTTAAAFADLDGDGDLDLLVNGLGHGTRVFANNGKGEFKELTPQTTGLSSNAGSMSLALADIDGDGDLDLYVANYRPTTSMDRPGARFTIGTVDGKQSGHCLRRCAHDFP
jgi:hypothetical protein